MVNPHSGNHEAEKYAPVLKNKLQSLGVSSKIFVSKSAEEMVESVKSAVDNKIDHIFILGGDGSVAMTVQIIAEVHEGPGLGIIPCGTVNNFYQSLGGTNDPRRAVDRLDNLKTTKIDLAKVNDQYILSTLSAGTIPETTWKVSTNKKELFGKFAYIMDGFKALGEEVPHTFTIKTEERTLEKTFSLFVIGLRGFVFGLPDFFPEATSNDGRLYFFGLDPSSLSQKLKVAKDVLYPDGPTNAKEQLTTELQFIHATITSDFEGFVTLDGNKGPRFPLEIKVIPEVLAVILP